MAEKDTLSTKDQLLHIAGDLFANYGFEAVSTRQIAEKAGVKLSAIHYHYGSKKNLYSAALTYAVEHDNCGNFPSVIEENPKLLENFEGLAEIIRTTVFRTFFDHFNKGDNPVWVKRLIIGEVMHPSQFFSIIIEAVVTPDYEAATKLYRRVKPDAVEAHIYAWLDILHSQLFTYIMAKDALELVRGKEGMGNDFYQQVARVVARAMILELELPLPRDLQ